VEVVVIEARRVVALRNVVYSMIDRGGDARFMRNHLEEASVKAAIPSLFLSCRGWNE
jgi:hypothetical protein